MARRKARHFLFLVAVGRCLMLAEATPPASRGGQRMSKGQCRPGSHASAVHGAVPGVAALAKRSGRPLESRELEVMDHDPQRTWQGAMMDAIAGDRAEGGIGSLHRKGMSIRRARVGDAVSWLHFLQALDQDTGFMLYQPGERPHNPARCEDAIRRIDAVRGAMLLLVWNAAGEVVGYVKGDILPLERKAHVMSVSCALLSPYRGDTGKAFLRYFLDEVEREGVVKRLEAVVMATNVRMMVVALSLGLSVEGIRRNAVRTPEGMLDEYVIVKLFD